MNDDQNSPEKHPLKQDSDNIQVSKIGDRSNVAAGRGAKAIQNIFVINGNVQWIPVSGVLLVTIGVLSFLLWSLRPVKPKEMTKEKEFKVAVAEFLVVDENGKPYRSDDGLHLASSLKEQLENKFNESNIIDIATWELWGPENTGRIQGATLEEREANAKAKVKEINAHIIIYGVLTFNGEFSSFTPEFYVDQAAFGNANELTGSHELGSPLLLALPFASQIQTVENPALGSRAKALSLITLGLAYYSVDDFTNAKDLFSQAEQDDRWLDRAGKEVVYLLLGNAYSRLLAQDRLKQELLDRELITKDDVKKELLERGLIVEDENPSDFQLAIDDDIQSAIENYEKAININPNYGRAYIGLAGTKLAQVSNTPEGMGKLQETEALLDKALTLENQPEMANIIPKTHYYRGQVAWLKAIYAKDIDESSKWFETATQEYRFVVDDYEQGDDLIRDFASQSYARLGVIASLRKDTDQSVEYIQSAITIASPFAKGEFYELLGQVYCDAKQEDNAASAYEKAIQVAESNGDGNAVKLYEDGLNTLNCGS
jgi:tetratricopeptide (TPR) repeat protein